MDNIKKPKLTVSRKLSLKRNPLTSSIQRKRKQRSEILRRTSVDISKHDQDIACELPVTKTSLISISTLDKGYQMDQKMTNTSQNLLSPVQEESFKGNFASSPNREQHQDVRILMKDMNIRLNPISLFPYTNKSDRKKKKSAEEEINEWESLFDPQFTFGSFHQGIFNSTGIAFTSTDDYFYKGKWPLAYEDMIGMIPSTTKITTHEKEDSHGPIHGQSNLNLFLFSHASDPILPDITQLEKMMMNKETYLDSTSRNKEENNTKERHNQNCLSPSAETSSYNKNKNSKDELQLWNERLELLNTIRNQVFCEKWNGTVQKRQTHSNRKGFTTAKFQQQLKQKAEKMRHEILMESHNDKKRQLSILIRNNNNLCDKRVHHRTDYNEQKSIKLSSSFMFEQVSSIKLDNECKKIAFNVPEEDIEQSKLKEENQFFEMSRKRSRPTFLLFVCGFLFPPLWIMNALYVPHSSKERSLDSKRIDRKWQRYSRNAFIVFFIFAILIILLIVVFKPALIGFRKMNEKVNQEGKIVFD
ncbi:uncharacterized protein BX663DRAFT_571516 [Cokeromyces recurvatus]|uniref:uncharacterized protein n=1 Tax=Cokeromyces recurvatus TaxID=90255 RepID=UPI00221F6CB3|nr:uncharacterized protein BX663DRAFT_571516 [Cokeromyces recurvatus]KAI7901606.1 hypothetical protein BX663DRAFT_571516 [Cokeromyces recurvatus]